MEFSQLKKEYPILGEILNLYDTLDQPLYENDQKENILNLCNNANLLKSKTTGEYKKFCEKLLKNLLQLKGTYNDDFEKRCSNLYVWLYFEIKKNKIPNDITKRIFDETNRIIKDKLKKTPCPYFNFNEKYHEPTELMKLRIFNDNVYTFQSMLKGLIKSDECSLKRYIYKCIEIYRAMNLKYCSRSDDNTEEKQNSCDIISLFNNFYKSYIFNIEGINHKFPELSSAAPLNLNDICPLEQSKSDSFPDETQGTPITRGVSTALSSMVGIPPFLILMYKFTPVRNLFRFGNKKHTLITSDFDKKMENELFHVINEDSNIKDIQPKYNVGYEAT